MRSLPDVWDVRSSCCSARVWWRRSEDDSVLIYYLACGGCWGTLQVLVVAQ